MKEWGSVEEASEGLGFRLEMTLMAGFVVVGLLGPALKALNWIAGWF